ncbi:WD40/YVTN/BNR-like repeat-containing protein [Georgenia sp. Z1344]|uniref:WD40/YVTN/BNR-like repeat-containing protein n=1 Tax=Georgenia sp. Z1344 TaxID=3416706 RepID=UPI003CF58F49
MSSSARRVLLYAGLGALVVLNVVLLALLLTRDVSAESVMGDAYTTPTAGSVTDESPSDEGTTPAESPSDDVVEGPTESESDAPAIDVPMPEPAERLIASASGDVAWRAIVGSCEAPGSVELTTDGGATWSPADVGGLAPVSRLKAITPAAVFAIGGVDPNCSPTYAGSVDGGNNWEQAPELAQGSWYIDPSDRAVLGTSVGEVDAPCEVAGLAGFDDNAAALLCTDGSLTVSNDGGASWTTAAEETNAVAIGLTLQGYVLAGSDEECAGTQIWTAGVEGDTAPVGCAEDVQTEAGQTAVSGAGGAMWLWADDETLVSTDGGSTW